LSGTVRVVNRVKGRKRALVFGGAGATALLLLVALYVAESTWDVRAVEVNRLLNVAAAWLAFASLLSAAAAATRGARAPWNVLAVGLVLLAVAETIVSYFTVVRGKMAPGLWVVNFALLTAYAVMIAGLAVKARSLPRFVFPRSKSILMLVVGAAFVFVFYQGVRLVLATAAMPWIVKAFVLAFPVADLGMLILAVYVSTTYGRGVAGRPWGAVAVGVSFLALSDFAGGLARAFADQADFYVALALLAQFAGYGSIAWGAWYQKALRAEV